MVVGVSNEPSGLLEQHIESLNIAYPIAKLKGEDADRIYGIKGFPASFLVDASGRIIWEGHPGSISRSEIEKALADAAFMAPIEGDNYKKLNKLISDRSFGDAMGEVESGLAKNADDESLKAAKLNLENLLKGKLDSAAKAVEAKDYGVALQTYKEVETLFSGHEAGKTAKATAKELEKNPDAKLELGAWKVMQKGDDAQFGGDFEKAGKVYAGVVKKFEGTKCAERAQAFLSRHPQ